MTLSNKYRIVKNCGPHSEDRLKRLNNDENLCCSVQYCTSSLVDCTKMFTYLLYDLIISSIYNTILGLLQPTAFVFNTG
jgi:hypothetical protein